MSFLIAGAVIFAAGSLFGACLMLTGQQSRTSRTSQRFQNVLLKNLEGKNDGPKNH